MSLKRLVIKIYCKYSENAVAKGDCRVFVDWKKIKTGCSVRTTCFYNLNLTYEKTICFTLLQRVCQRFFFELKMCNVYKMGTLGARQMLLKGPQAVIILESLVKKLSQRDVPDTILIPWSKVRSGTDNIFGIIVSNLLQWPKLSISCCLSMNLLCLRNVFLSLGNKNDLFLYLNVNLLLPS